MVGQSGADAEARPALDVRRLAVEFGRARASVRAVDDVSFAVGARQTLGIVGESGSGKTVTALSLLRLIPTSIGRVHALQILLDGEDLMALTQRQMRAVRGNRISMIFQEPMTSLN